MASLSGPLKKAAWRGPRATLRGFLYFAIVAQILVGWTVTIRESWAALELAQNMMRESPLEARRRALGFDYAIALEGIERAIPLTGEYILVDRGPDGAFVLLQGDLAPRRARLLDRRTAERLRARGVELPASAVVFRGVNTNPQLLRTEELFAEWPP